MNRRDTIAGRGEENTDNLFVARTLELEKPQLDILIDMGAQEAPQLQSILDEFRAGLAQRISREAMMLLEEQLASSYPRKLAQALQRGDTVRYMATWRDFAKGFAEARIPFYQLDEILRHWEVAIFGFLVRTYRDPATLRMALEARQRLAHIYTTVAAQAYAEVYELSMNTLVGDMEAELERGRLQEKTLRKLWEAIIWSARGLGMQEFLPRMVAGNMVREGEPILPDLTLSRTGKVTVPHKCVAGCKGEVGSCLTAYLVEATVNNFYREAVQIQTVSLTSDGMCELVLGPLEGRTERVASPSSEEKGAG